MDRSELEASIIKDLSRHRGRNDIITRICEASGMKWSDAETLVAEVEATHGEDITDRQKPFMSVLSIATIIIGFALSIGILVATFQGWMLLLLRLPIPYLGNLLLFLLGILIIIGGARGLYGLADGSS